MRYIRFALITIVLYTSYVFATQECAFPKSPGIPMGSNVSKKDLKKAVAEFKSYQNIMKNYRTCLDSKKRLTTREGMTEEAIQKNIIHNAEIDALYNYSIDREQSAADLLNQEIRRFQSK